MSDSQNRAFGWPKNTVKAVLALALVGSVITVALVVILMKEAAVTKAAFSLVFTPIVLMADRVIRDYFQKGGKDDA